MGCFDKDDFDVDEFNKAIQTAKKNGIGCAWSNEAFELWFLLHFYNSDNEAVHAGRKKYGKYMEKAMKKHGWKNFKYKKNDESIYEYLDKYGDKMQAIKRAENLAKKCNGDNFADHYPCTHVFELVEELMGMSETFNRKVSR
jgi:hypothetical protein